MGNYDPYQIDRYLMKQLPLEEEVAFEKEISRDANLAKAVEEQKKLIQFLQLSGKLNARKQIKTITKNWKDYVPALSKAKTSALETIAKKTEKKIEELTQLAFQFFIPYSVSYRNAASATMNEQEKAYHLYAKKDYEGALPLLLKLPDKNVEARLMTGIALLALHKSEEAYKEFEKLINEKPLGFLSDAHWYASLAALCINKTQQSNEHLQFIIEDENSDKKLKTKAEGLLNDLKLMN